MLSAADLRSVRPQLGLFSNPTAERTTSKSAPPVFFTSRGPQHIEPSKSEGREREDIILEESPFLGKSQRQDFSAMSLVITTCQAMSKSNVRPSTPQLSLCFQKAAREDITISCEMRYSISCKMQLTFQASQCYCSSANVASK